MNKLKATLVKFKNNVQENPVEHAVALATGITVGALYIYIATKKGDADVKLPHLEMTEGIAQYMIDSGSTTLFQTPLGDFELSYVNNQ